MTQKQNSRTIFILSSIIVIQFGVIVYLLLDHNGNKLTVAQNTHTILKDSIEIVTKIEEFKLVGEDLKKLKAQMLASGITKDSIGTELDAMLEALWQVEMGGAITLDELNTKIAQAKKLLVVKDLQIKRLKDRSDSLSFQAKVLKSEREAQTQQLTEMLDDTKELSEKLSVASRVKAENIKITGISKKDKTVDKEVYKSKDLTKINISFRLADNKITKVNTPITLLYRIIKVGSVVIFDEMNGGGYFKTVDNENIPYTGKQEIQFDNSQQEVSFIYKAESEYAPGIYKVELYADGYSIGESQFKTK
jgi:hypothetical protein